MKGQKWNKCTTIYIEIKFGLMEDCQNGHSGSHLLFQKKQLINATLKLQNAYLFMPELQNITMRSSV